jgi:hypothetical protein
MRERIALLVTFPPVAGYSAQQLRERLRHLPCRFNLGSLHFQWEALERMKGSASLQYDLVENTGFRNEI